MSDYSPPLGSAVEFNFTTVYVIPSVPLTLSFSVIPAVVQSSGMFLTFG